MAVDRIGGSSRVSRDSASAGFEALEKHDRLEQQQKPARNEKVYDAAKMYEKQFLREMVKAMRGTVSFGAEKPSMGEGIYRDQLDSEYVESWGDNGGVGLADLIYDQVMDRYFNQTGDGKSLKSQGMMELTDRDVSRVIRIKTTETPGQVPLRIELKKSNGGEPAQLKMPWAGQVVSNSRLEGGKTALTLSHGPSLRSTLIFKGVAAAEAQPGQQLEKGKVVGILSPEVHSFTWNLNKGAATSQPDPDHDPGLASSR